MKEHIMVGLDDELDRRLAASNPLPEGVLNTEASLATLDAIRLRARSGAREAPVPTRRRLSWLLPATRRGALVFSAAGMLAVGGAAAATTAIISTYTGQATPPGIAKAVGAGEDLAVGGAGYCDAVNRLTADVPYPSGYATAWRDWALLAASPNSPMTIQQLCGSTTPLQVLSGTKNVTTVISTGGVDGLIAHSAFCAWTDDWLKAKAAGDTATATTDATEIAGALQWPASRTADPSPNDAVTSTTLGDSTGSTMLGWFTDVQSAVAAGNVSQVSQVFNYYATPAAGPSGAECTSFRPPANSVNGTDMTAATLTPSAQNGS
jgi:hypothetical protein